MDEQNPKPAGPTRLKADEPGLFDLLWLAIRDIPAMMRTMKFAVWVFIILAVFTLIGTVLPQESLSSNPVDFGMKYQALFNADPSDGKVTFGELIYNALIVRLELYRIFDSGLYFTLLALLAISSILCAWDRFRINRVLLKLTKAKVNAASILSMGHSAELSTELGIEHATGRLRDFLIADGFQIFEDSDEQGSHWFLVRKNVVRHWASVVFHMAFAVILIGGIIGDDRVLGYEGGIKLGEGEYKALGNEIEAHARAVQKGQEYQPGSDELIQLVDYENVYRERDFSSVDPETGFPADYRGMPSDYVSRLRIVRHEEGTEDQVVMEKAIEVNYPLYYRGVGYYQSAIDYAIHLTAGVPGAPPSDIGVALDEPFQIPGLGLECVVTMADIVGGVWEAADGTRTELPYSVRLVDYSLYDAGMSDRPILLGYVGADRPLTIEGVTISLLGVEEYTILQYVHDPGVPIVYVGGFLLIIGLTIALYMPYRMGRIMLISDGKGVRCVVGGSYGEFPELVERGLKR